MTTDERTAPAAGAHADAIPTDPAAARAALWDEIFELDDVLGRAYGASCAAAAIADSSRPRRAPPDVERIGLDHIAWEVKGSLEDIRERYYRVFELAKAAGLNGEEGRRHA